MPQTAHDLVVVGELNPDLMLDATSAEVRFGQVETELSHACITLGSSGAITAVAAQTFGLHVAMVAVVGDDHLGVLTLELLREKGVDTDAVLRRADVATGLTVVVSAPGGDRTLLTYPGAMAALRCRDVPSGVLAETGHVHVSSAYLQQSLLPDLANLFADLRAAGVTTSLDPGWDPREQWHTIADVLALTDYLMPNEAELTALASALGLRVDLQCIDRALAAARQLAGRGPTVVLKRGGRGGAVANRDAAWVLDIEPVVAVDTTGAGDNFNAGFLYGLRRGASPAEALSFAVAAGTASVQGRGGTGHVATLDELTRAAARLLPDVRRVP